MPSSCSIFSVWRCRRVGSAAAVILAMPLGMPGADGWVAGSWGVSGSDGSKAGLVVDLVDGAGGRHLPTIADPMPAPAPSAGNTVLWGADASAARLAWRWHTVGDEKGWERRWASLTMPLASAPLDLSRHRRLVLWLRPTAVDGSALQVHLRDAAGHDGPALPLAELALAPLVIDRWTPVALDAEAATAGIDRTQVKELQFQADGWTTEGATTAWHLRLIELGDQEPAPGLAAVGWVDLGSTVGVTWRLGRPIDAVRLTWGDAAAQRRELPATAGWAEIPRPPADQPLTITPLRGSTDGIASNLRLPAKPAVVDTTITVTGTARATPVSRWLFGTNGYQEWYNPRWSAQLADSGATAIRWGGNTTSTYNWRDDVDCAGNDWFYLVKGRPVNQTIRDSFWWRFVHDARRDGMAVVYTIPIGDWVAKRPAPGAILASYPKSRYPQQQKFEPNGADAGNGRTPDGSPIWDNDPAWAYQPNSLAFQEAWFRAAVQEFGTAERGGIQMVALDNEIGLWHDTHRDIAAKGLSAVELLERNLAHARMLKSIDPSVQVLGLASWGAMDLAGSDVDWYPPGEDGYRRRGKFATPDEQWRERRTVRGGQDVLTWYLDQVREAEAKDGRKLIDALSINWYPQTQYLIGGKKVTAVDLDGDQDPVALAAQFDTLGHWHDPAFDNPRSWMKDSPENIEKLWDPYNPFLPKVQAAIAAHNPGTKLAVTEWRTGSDGTFPGALLHTELVGIMMAEDVWLSTHWYGTAPDQWGYWGHALLGNWDGARSTVGGRWLPMRDDDDQLTVFATEGAGRRHLVLVNRDPQRGRQISLATDGATRIRQALVVRTAGQQVVRLPARPVSGSTITVQLPPFSANVVVLDAGEAR